MLLVIFLKKGLKKHISLFCSGLLVKFAGLDDLAVHVELVLGTFQDVLLNGFNGNEAIDTNFLRLANAVGTIRRETRFRSRKRKKERKEKKRRNYIQVS